MNHARYNNFHLRFLKLPSDNYCPNYRNDSTVQRLREELPDLDRELTENLTREYFPQSGFRKPLREILPKYERDLYEAYKIMRDYVESDWKLFD